MTWDDMEYWSSSEWETVQERLDKLDEQGISYNPAREKLFFALDELELENVRVCFVGQDPYPSSKFATGKAFSIPSEIGIHKFQFPPTLNNIFDEYVRDLNYPFPTTGCLDKWSRQGVLLWNAIPSCITGQSLSHNWPEWKKLTTEIITLLSERTCVFVFMGRIAKEFMYLAEGNRFNLLIATPHPSPRAVSKENSTRNRMILPHFSGSRIFSTINSHLVDPIDWKLT